ncbi:DKNYY domain-containing protein [Flavobacterium tegetincola]|uniref:DKNYY domain-containing protein n=1 Tax=Flavobacterium tegetincola TaxID=150172 RepID=UPI00047D3CAC|nr:DKNYY domain-containing protein [Flavobacterium tegetincola]
MTITFKGQLLTKNYVFIYVLISVVTFSLVFALYYFKVYEWLFQLFGFALTSPFSLMIIVIPPILLSLYISSSLASLFFPKQVQISLSDEDFKIEFGTTKVNIPLQEINEIIFFKRSERWDRITIKTDKITHINIGIIFSGITIPEIDQILARLKNVLTKNQQYYYTANTAVANNHSFTISKLEPGKERRKLILKLSLGLASVFAVIIIAISIVIYSKSGDGVSLHNEQDIGSSVFTRYQGKVYALKVGDGYFELKGADFHTFKPFVFGQEYGTNIGKDKNSVFANGQKIASIDINTAEYLGLCYIKDAKNVFYKTLKIPSADAATFKSLTHSAGFNTLAFRFGTDKNHVYYRDSVVKYANPNTISSVDDTFDYVKDQKNAFYRTQLLPNVNVKNFHAVKTNFQIFYASDGKKHFINGMQFPATANNKLFGTTAVDLNHLVSLQIPTANARHLLFSDNKAIYYYDDEKKEFICGANLQGLKPFYDAIFSDGQFVYYTKTGNLASSKYGSIGSQTNIYKTKIKRNQLVVFARLEGFVVYKNDDEYYITINGENASLRRIKFFASFNDEILKAGRSSVSKRDAKYFEEVPNAELVLEIKTKKRNTFEDEND